MLETREVRLVVSAVASCSTHAGLRHWNFDPRNCCASDERCMSWRRLNVADGDLCPSLHCISVYRVSDYVVRKLAVTMVHTSQNHDKISTW